MKKKKFNHSKKPKLISNKSCPINVRIDINNIIHLKFLKKHYIGMLSWYESQNDYRMEVYTKHKTIKLSYNSLIKWKSVLEIISNEI